jgi:hypothetical protein
MPCILRHGLRAMGRQPYRQLATCSLLDRLPQLFQLLRGLGLSGIERYKASQFDQLDL